MRRQHCYQWEVLSKNFQQQWMSPLLGIVLTLAVVGVWQELLQEELQAGVQSSLLNVVLFGGVIGAWTLALAVYLGQRSERYARQARKINQQLQQEIFERQRIETELRSRETSIRSLTARLELAVESAQIGIWDWDIIADRLIWNDQMYKLYGLKPSDFSGVYEAWATALHPDDFELTTTAIQQAIRGEREYEPEFRVIHPDGTVRFIQAHAVVQRDAQGQAQRMIGVNFDITERKQSELVLKESEAKYRQLVNHINMGFVVHAPDAHILQCNETACELLGLSIEQMLGKEAIDPTWHFLREDGTVMPVEEYPVHRVLSTQVPLKNYVLGIYRGTQSQAWVLVTAFPEFDINNHLKQIVVTFIDISQLKRAETELREMAEVMENAISGISKLDAEGRYLYVNKAYADITGYRPEEMIGMSWQRTVHPDDLAPLNIAYQQMRQDGKVEVEARGVRQDGSSFYKHLVMISAYDQQQQFIGHYCFMKDISDRKAIEEELQQSESTLRSFFNNEAMLMGIVELHDHDIFHLADNQTTASFFGITSEAMKNRFASEMGVSRPQLERWIQAYQEAACTQSPVHFEYSHETPSGQFWLAATVCQVDNHANHYPRFSYIVEDITERKQTELALENELMRSQMLFNISIDGIVVVNHQGDVVKTSSSFARMLGYTVEETLQLNLTDWDAQWTREELQQILQQSLELPPVFETRHRRKDGSVYDVEISYSRVEIDGEMMHFCICRNISERKRSEAEHKQAEIALQNSQARFAGILEIASDAIISVNGEQQITLFNKGAERIFGYTAEEVLGQPLALLMPDRFAQAHCHHVKEYAHSGSQTRQMAHRGAIFGRRKDGTEFPAEASISRLTLDGETIFTTFLRDVTERKQAELALQESEQRFQAFMQNAPLLAWIADSEGRLLYANATFFDFIGSTPMTAIGKPIQALFPEKLAQRCLHNSQLVLETGTVVETIEDVPAPDGSERECLVRKFPIQRHDQTIWVGGVAFDITEQRQAEEALRQSEATKQAIIAAIPDLLIRMRADGSYVDFISDSRFNIVNPAHIRQDAHVYDILPPDLAQLRLDYSQQALASGITQIYEQGIVIEGKQRYEEVRIVALLQNEVLIMVRDITDRKQAEEELRHQKEMFQVIVDNIPVMIALFNDQGRIDFINPEFERTLGWSLAEWQQRDVMVDLYPDPIYLQGVLDHMTAAMGNWKDFTTLTATQQQIETSWTNVPISKGRFLGIGQDISDRKRKETALQQAMEAAEAANLAKSMFLANMSHELRTPLNVILGFAQVMSHDSSLTPNQRDDLQTIQRSSDHLLSLINDVLDLSKIEAGHCTLEESGFDLISLLHTLRTMMIERTKTKQLQLTFEIAPEVPQFIIADEQKLRQVLLNLLSNAIKFTKQGSIILRVTSWESSEKTCLIPNAPHDPSLKHSTSSVACTLQFEVADTGVGIAVSEQQAIFDAFTQAEAGRKSIGGTGLGLTISRRLLELMDGNISVESTPGMGSTFTVTVPVCPTSGVDGQVEQQERTIIGLVPGQPHRRILVVDDQRENRLLMVRLLTHLGLDVREATNGQEAIALWQQWKPDLTWMDIRMPGLDGYEATKQIREMEHERASIIIALTAQASQSDRALALAAGCNDYISKPFREETLFLKLKEYLGLEYLYAEVSDLSNSFSISILDANADHLGSIDPAMLAQVPADWLETLEDLALCGDDRAIVDLANQLAPAFDNFRMQLLNLANRFEFEQIVHLIHRGSSS
jgi:PAS domain S-box-containing protein